MTKTIVNGRRTKAKATKLQEVGLEIGKAYPLAEAIELTKKLSPSKFDASVEVHFKLGIDPRKGDQQIRAAISLPHGTGKTVRVAAFVMPENEAACRTAGADLVGGEELIETIAKSEKTDFEVAVAEPMIMRQLSKIAKILGTRGLMPSPKTETVTTNPSLAVGELKKGKISFKNDDTANLHILLGKVSFDSAKLAENFAAVLDTVRKAKPASSKGAYIKNCVITSAMGPGIKIQL
ncbi:50S ribosomal protein L1 [Candidatus Falkowbacteria bacterium CG10_big_fil_rev_8_21_14_0_10_37_14]|uniref:Large ribosomal subunit protein uL1 n=1 Tax=Candidatus Falkowbacteria bacterium CG10_big_fil_rev_8_21_14_0_10_37_14 TaxID=1974561 RepID=A0A2M6WSR1_9BACT|nr:50S ribosomal protein L1 [Candidatus Falkowbacteria bacterium]PIT95791.1 MAG: 50S ribosomal protein L1 [Candidatus Falkowbacteria bacterium CG10_big_fil_rev_8_21_14_0_10_37_14]